VSKAYVVMFKSFRYNDEGYNNDGEYESATGYVSVRRIGGYVACRSMNEEFVRRYSKLGKYGSAELAMYISALGDNANKVFPKLFSDWYLKRDLTEDEICSVARSCDFYEVVEVDLYE